MSAKLPDTHTIYVSPTGKRCVFVPSSSQSAWLYFRYLDNTELQGEGFRLSWRNFSLMRPHARQRGVPDAAAR